MGMRYRVAFAKRLLSNGGESALDPSAELDEYLADGVVADKTLVEQLESQAEHSQEALDEDDAFLGSAAPAVWEYDVVDERRQEFEDAAANSETVLEFEVIDDTPTEADELTAGSLGESESAARKDSAGQLISDGAGVRGRG